MRYKKNKKLYNNNIEDYISNKKYFVLIVIINFI